MPRGVFFRFLSDLADGGCYMDEMNQESDAQLLALYVGQGDENAFREIVARHTGMVYASALRQVQSPDFAREVAQCVFTDFAFKAPTLKFQPDASLMGWFYRATRFASLNLLREERRRASRERQAMEQFDASSTPSPDWVAIQPLFDEAMAELSEADREALLLRFFKSSDFRVIGQHLGVSDDAAQKRVSRALERLRDFLVSRGVTTTSGALSCVGPACLIGNTPPGLDAVISSAALAGAALKTSIAAATVKTIFMTTTKKVLLGTVLMAMIGAGIYKAIPSSSGLKALSQRHYAMRGELTWGYGMHVTRYPIEILRDGDLFKLTQINSTDETHYFAMEYQRSAAGAINVSHFSKDINSPQQAGAPWNNGSVTLSHFNVPENLQFMPAWLMLQAREEYDRKPGDDRIALYGNGEFHIRSKVKPTVKAVDAWRDGFNEYSEVSTNFDQTMRKTFSFRMDSWTNVSETVFPKSCSGSLTTTPIVSNLPDTFQYKPASLRYSFVVKEIMALREPIDMRIPVRSPVTDWRPREDGRTQTGLGYDTTNGFLFPDVIKAQKERKVSPHPALDYMQSMGLQPRAQAPDFEVVTLEGRNLKLSALRGKWVILDFWSTTCAPCLSVIPGLKEIHRTFGSDDRLVMIGFALDDDETAVKQFAESKELGWHQVILPQGFQAPLVKDYKVPGIPTIYLIDPDGTIFFQGEPDKDYIQNCLNSMSQTNR